MPEIVGVTFPIPKSFMARFFEEGKTVFIKPATIFKNLQEGMKFVFYQSQIDRGYVGEAIIKGFTFRDDPFSFFDIYGDDIFLTREELLQYIQEKEKWSKGRTKRPRRWIAIQLDSIKIYELPIKPTGFVSVSGQYLTSGWLER